MKLSFNELKVGDKIWYEYIPSQITAIQFVAGGKLGGTKYVCKAKSLLTDEEFEFVTGKNGMAYYHKYNEFETVRILVDKQSYYLCNIENGKLFLSNEETLEELKIDNAFDIKLEELFKSKDIMIDITNHIYQRMNDGFLVQKIQDMTYRVEE